MNWYKLAQLERTLPYFKEFEEYGDYVPKPDKLRQTLQDRFNTSIVKDIGHGDSGVAYLLDNGDVLKITTNPQEGRVATYLMENPNPNVVDYKHIWKEGDLYYIIMERIDEMVNQHPLFLVLFERIKEVLEQKGCYNPYCAQDIVKNMPELRGNPFVGQILEYIKHLSKSNIKIFDFLNPANIGLKDGKIKFFDIT